MRSSRPGSTHAAPPTAPKAAANKPREGLRSEDAGPTGSVVDPVWLLKALSISVGVALLCGYISFCLLFYQGQWQLVLHPTHNAGEPVFGRGGKDEPEAQAVHFSPDISGMPQLQGWWIPAPPDGQYRHLTVLYLGSEDGQVSNVSSLLVQLQKVGLNVFAFDYRGFGASAPAHPSQARMNEDANAALTYLSTVRGIPPARTVIYGAGVGASLAVSLAGANQAIPALVLDSPEPDLRASALRDPRARILPVRLLFKETFPLFPDLARLRTPKLILTRTPGEKETTPRNTVRAAADPKLAINLNAGEKLPEQTLSHFLDEYAPAQ